ncbi:SagB/ThcOx family dehydrogenase [Rhizocola hellebori]|uniref:SagB/ThcOx family dehydrogenase n=1 Tax=Rhizocola hellebori TaxID=1392758 RepID=UPI001945B595|nr:SagB/ThcOx family dehydrogenase [Rhizocola hellebori]
MSSAGHDEAPWPVGMRVRPAVDPASPDVEVADTVTGKRFRWAPESLARFILDGGVSRRDLAGDGDSWQKVFNANTRTHLVPGWRHWQDRGWHPSDQYYAASRRWDFVDATDIDGAIRTDAVRRYLSTDGPPAEEAKPTGPRIPLGQPKEPGDMQVSQLLVTRRSGRAYLPKPVPLERLSGLLWYALAEVRKRREATSADEPMSYLDSYGSAWDFYLCVYNVDGLEAGVYRYEILTHELIGIRPGDHRDAMIDALQGMHSPATAAWTLGFVADFPRYQWRYRHEHGLRRLYLESGILAQEVIILGMSYGLSTLVTPAQKDRPYLDLHRLSESRYSPVYTLTMGFSRGSSGVDFADESRDRTHTGLS